MPVPKKKDATPATATPPAASTQDRSRKPWKKKTPVQILLDQVDKLREEIKQDEEALKQKKEQLLKFEEVRKIFETK